MRDDTTTGNRRLDESIEFFVSTNRQLQVTRSNTFDLQIFACVSGEFEYFGGEVFQNSRSIYGGRGSDAVSLMYRRLEETVNTTDGELQTGL